MFAEWIKQARVAIYYTPGMDDQLYEAGCAWLGRDPLTGLPGNRPDIPGLDSVTEDPRLYGFHATLKPPMRLRPGTTWNNLMDAARNVAGLISPFVLPPLAVTDLHGFLALRETQPCFALQALADACVIGFDPLRVPPSEDELARRRRAGLTAEQDAMLLRYGYPYVLDTWFFHMTLTRRLAPEEQSFWRPRAEAYFAEVAGVPRPVTEICLFTQAQPGASFAIAERIPLTGEAPPSID